MATSPEQRFKHIFANTNKPPLPDSGQPHLAETELQYPNQPGEMQYQIPNITPEQRNLVSLDNSVARDIISSSEDEDDYVDAFRSSLKPSMLSPKQQTRIRYKRSPKSVVEKFNVSSDTNFSLSPNRDQSAPDVSLRGPRYSAEIMDRDNDVETSILLPKEDKNGNRATGHFCVFSLVAKFPYKYMNDPKDRVSKRFFANNQFYSRKWDVYYIHPPENVYASAITLLPVEQVQKLLEEISLSFHIDIDLPPAPFTMSFFDDTTPQPIFLGTSRSRTEYEELQKKTIPASNGHGECPSGATHSERGAFKDFRKKCEDARFASKNKTSKKEKRAKEKIVAFHQASNGLRRSQRYFGLRSKKVEMSYQNPLCWDSQSGWEDKHEKAPIALLQPLDVNQKAPYHFEQDVVIIAFDVEANEHAHHLITEIGVSTLDTYDLHDLPPGSGGENWIKQIRSRHFRIKEHSHMRNRTFVSGNPDGFYFGVSEFVSLKGEAVEAVDGCFSFPFSHGFQHDGQNSIPFARQPAQRGSENRRLVLVGHDTQADMDFLCRLGSKIFSSPVPSYPPVARHEVLTRIEEALDIAALYRTLKNEVQTRSLGGIMSDLGRDAWGLHNGGNDARYTLECLVGMMIKARLEDDEKAEKAAEEQAELDRELYEKNREWAISTGEAVTKTKSEDSGPDLGKAKEAETDGKIEKQNCTQTLREVELDVETDLKTGPILSTDHHDHVANEVNEHSTAASVPDANKFLDPTLTPADACPPLPGRGRHYGSDNELDEISDDDDYDNDLLYQETRAKLKLEENAEGDEGSDSEFEM